MKSEAIAEGRAKVSGLDDEMDAAIAKMLTLLEPYDRKSEIKLDVGTVRDFYEAFLTNRRSGRTYREMLETLADSQDSLIRVLQRTALIQSLIGIAAGIVLGVIISAKLHLAL
jgi:hypothetical protein